MQWEGGKFAFVFISIAISVSDEMFSGKKFQLEFVLSKWFDYNTRPVLNNEKYPSESMVASRASHPPPNPDPFFLPLTQESIAPKCSLSSYYYYISLFIQWQCRWQVQYIEKYAFNWAFSGAPALYVHIEIIIICTRWNGNTLLFTMPNM